jgi:hypothetical protein
MQANTQMSAAMEVGSFTTRLMNPAAFRFQPNGIFLPHHPILSIRVYLRNRRSIPTDRCPDTTDYTDVHGWLKTRTSITDQVLFETLFSVLS